MRFHAAVGCERCGGSGYRGRVGLYELMVVTDHLKDLILRRASATEISRATEGADMTHLRQDGLITASLGVPGRYAHGRGP